MTHSCVHTDRMQLQHNLAAACQGLGFQTLNPETRLRDDGLVRLRHDAAVGRAADVAQQLLPAGRRAAAEQAAAVDGAQRRDALAARVQLPKACNRVEGYQKTLNPNSGEHRLLL